MLIVGDCRETMRRWVAEGVRVQTCVTSPPYWGLRDYGCVGQLGLEPTIAEYVENMVEVFRLVRELLADDGTLWLNLGDSYSTQAGKVRDCPGGGFQGRDWQGPQTQPNRLPQIGLKPKDLCGIPWRVAFALQADGWYLRSDIIWAKPNPMPESVTDRPTKSHEYLFLLSKSERYYYDAAAIAEPRASNGGSWVNGWASGASEHSPLAHARDKGDAITFRGGGKYTNGQEKSPDVIARGSTGNGPALANERNRRSVWTIATEPFAEAHFATFPTALVEPCIMAGSRVGDTVLDPFMGSGTVAQVAQDLGRRWLGCELSPEYAKLIAKRTAQSAMTLEAAA